MRYGHLSVGGCPSDILDETHCFWVMCPHPCCWEAEQRVARGVGRRITLQSKTPVNSRTLLQEEFPTLNIVNVSEWAKTRKPQKKKMHRAFCSESYHSFTSQSLLYSQPQDSNVRLESLQGLHFPKLTSAAKSPHSHKYKRKDVKLSLAQISPLDHSSGASSGSVSVVVWIPNPNYISHNPSHHRRKSPTIAVRDLACVPSSHLYDMPKPNRKKSRNVKKTEHLQLTCTQLTSPNWRPPAPGHMVPQISLHTSDTDLTEPRMASAIPAEAELAAGGNQWVLRSEPPPEPPPCPHPSPPGREPSACLSNKPAAVHSERERGPRRDPAHRGQTRLAQYRLENSANGTEGIDWLRLRSQTYLWKKHNRRQNCDKDKPVLAPPQPPQHWAGPHRLSKATVHHHHRGSLEIGSKMPTKSSDVFCLGVGLLNFSLVSFLYDLAKGPAVCGCVECVEEIRGWGGDGHSAAAGFPKPLDTGNIGDRRLNGENANGSRSSALELADSSAALQSSLECRATVRQESGSVGRVFGRSQSRGTEGRDRESDSDSEDEDFQLSESHLSAPPPSLRSDLVD